MQIVATCMEIIKFLGNVWIKKSGAPKTSSKCICATIVYAEYDYIVIKRLGRVGLNRALNCAWEMAKRNLDI